MFYTHCFISRFLINVGRFENEVVFLLSDNSLLRCDVVFKCFAEAELKGCIIKEGRNG